MPSLHEPLLLVMCTGNVCRSPMAEGLFTHYLAKRGLQAQVISRGLAAPTGRVPHQYAIEVARRHGVPLASDKRAAAVNGADVTQAALVFVMDIGQRQEVQRRYTAASGKTFLLGHWQNREIRDPINEPIETFEAVWQQCDAGVQAWVERLCAAGLITAKEIA